MNKAKSVTAADAELAQALKKRQQARSLSQCMSPEMRESVERVSRLTPEQRAQKDQWAFSQLAGLTPEQEAAVEYLLTSAFAMRLEEEAEHDVLLEALRLSTQSRREEALEKLAPARGGVRSEHERRKQVASGVMERYESNPGSWARLLQRELNVSRATAYRLIDEAKKESSHRASP